MFLKGKRIFICLCLCCLFGVNDLFAVRFVFINGGLVVLGERKGSMTLNITNNPINNIGHHGLTGSEGPYAGWIPRFPLSIANPLAPDLPTGPVPAQTMILDNSINAISICGFAGSIGFVNGMELDIKEMKRHMAESIRELETSGECRVCIEFLGYRLEVNIHPLVDYTLQGVFSICGIKGGFYYEQRHRKIPEIGYMKGVAICVAGGARVAGLIGRIIAEEITILGFTGSPEGEISYDNYISVNYVSLIATGQVSMRVCKLGQWFSKNSNSSIYIRDAVIASTDGSSIDVAVVQFFTCIAKLFRIDLGLLNCAVVKDDKIFLENSVFKSDGNMQFIIVDRTNVPKKDGEQLKDFNSLIKINNCVFQLTGGLGSWCSLMSNPEEYNRGPSQGSKFCWEGDSKFLVPVDESRALAEQHMLYQKNRPGSFCGPQFGSHNEALMWYQKAIDDEKRGLQAMLIDYHYLYLSAEGIYFNSQNPLCVSQFVPQGQGLQEKIVLKYRLAPENCVAGEEPWFFGKGEGANNLHKILIVISENSSYSRKNMVFLRNCTGKPFEGILQYIFECANSFSNPADPEGAKKMLYVSNNDYDVYGYWRNVD